MPDPRSGRPGADHAHDPRPAAQRDASRRRAGRRRAVSGRRRRSTATPPRKLPPRPRRRRSDAGSPQRRTTRSWRRGTSVRRRATSGPAPRTISSHPGRAGTHLRDVAYARRSYGSRRPRGARPGRSLLERQPSASATIPSAGEQADEDPELAPRLADRVDHAVEDQQRRDRPERAAVTVAPIGAPLTAAPRRDRRADPGERGERQRISRRTKTPAMHCRSPAETRAAIRTAGRAWEPRRPPIACLLALGRTWKRRQKQPEITSGTPAIPASRSAWRATVGTRRGFPGREGLRCRLRLPVPP